MVAIIQHVVDKEKPFEDGFLFFCFTSMAKNEDLKVLAKTSFDICSSIDVWKLFIDDRIWISQREKFPWIMFG
jgi:hypothetical protein